MIPERLLRLFDRAYNNLDPDAEDAAQALEEFDREVHAGYARLEEEERRCVGYEEYRARVRTLCRRQLAKERRS